MAARNSVDRKRRRAFDSCIILVSWVIWKERNNRVFNQDSTPIHLLLQRISDEFGLWRMVGAHCLEALTHLK